MPSNVQVLSITALIAFAGSATGQPPAQVTTFPFPASAPLVVQLNGIESSQKRFSNMIEALPATERKLVRGWLTSALNGVMKGRKLTTVPGTGRVYLVVRDLEKVTDPEPALALVLPSKDYAEFRKSFLTPAEVKSFEPVAKGIDSIRSTALGDEQTLYLVDLKDHVVITPDRATAEAYTTKFDRATTAAMGPDLAGSFLNADLALYVNMSEVNAKYGEQIKEFKSLLDFAFKGGMIPELNKKQAEMARLAVAGVFQALEDCRGIVVATEFRPEGLNLRFQARFGPDTETGRLLDKERPGPFPELGRLPNGLMAYSAVRFSPQVQDLARKLDDEFSPADDDAAGAKQIEKLMMDLAAARQTGEVSAVSGSNASLTVTRYESPTKAATTLVELYRSLSAGARLHDVVLKERPKVVQNARKYGGFTFTEIGAEFDLEATVKELPETAREAALLQLKRVVKDRMTYWVGTDGKLVVTISAADWDAATKLLAGYLENRAGIGTEPGFRLTREQLPAETNWISLFETGQTIALLVDYFREASKALPGEFPPIAEVTPPKGPSTYLGAALTLKPEIATVDLFIPGTSMGVAIKMLAPLFKSFE